MAQVAHVTPGRQRRRPLPALHRDAHCGACRCCCGLLVTLVQVEARRSVLEAARSPATGTRSSSSVLLPLAARHPSDSSFLTRCLHFASLQSRRSTAHLHKIAKSERCPDCTRMPRRTRHGFPFASSAIIRRHTMPFNRGTILRILPLLALFFADAQRICAKRQRRRRARHRHRSIRRRHSRRHGSSDQRRQRARPHRDHRRTGQFVFPNVPFNPYRISVSANGFAPAQAVSRFAPSVGTNLKLVLQIAGGQLRPSPSKPAATWSRTTPPSTPTSTATCSSRCRWRASLPRSAPWSLLTTPGVAADSNGLFHGLGDHASNSFSVDGQSITDQQSKVFSNQLPSNSIQSIEVISGAPPAEYGGKTSLVIVATTRSGQGVTKPTGSISSSYGTFGSATSRLRSVLWRQELGQLHRGRRPEHGPLPRSAGVHRLSRQGQRRELLRSRGLQLYRGRLDAPRSELQPLVVPDARTPSTT